MRVGMWGNFELQGVSGCGEQARRCCDLGGGGRKRRKVEIRSDVSCSSVRRKWLQMLLQPERSQDAQNLE